MGAVRLDAGIVTVEAVPGERREDPAGRSSRPEAGREGLVLRARLALYAAAAALLFVLERLVPTPLPWVRLGLPNVVTLLVLLQHGGRAAAVVLGLRLVLGGFFAGTLFGPQFALSSAGGVASFAVMLVAARLGSPQLSPLGLSLLGAAAHAVAQLGVVGVWFAGRSEILSLLPLFLAIALVTGSITGLAADALLARLDLARTPRAGA
jgi:heptaprenyl diphosphate synthase